MGAMEAVERLAGRFGFVGGSVVISSEVDGAGRAGWISFKNHFSKAPN